MKLCISVPPFLLRQFLPPKRKRNLYGMVNHQPMFLSYNRSLEVLTFCANLCLILRDSLHTCTSYFVKRLPGNGKNPNRMLLGTLKLLCVLILFYTTMILRLNWFCSATLLRLALEPYNAATWTWRYIGSCCLRIQSLEQCRTKLLPNSTRDLSNRFWCYQIPSVLARETFQTSYRSQTFDHITR